jgi:benzil reductase ((S)-benzoin forming)
MKHFIITGTSAGIGKALAEAALILGHSVTGISRRAKLSHPRYHHLTLDLSDQKALNTLELDLAPEAEQWILVNNAGSIAPVKPVAELAPDQAAASLFLNLSAPVLLAQKFLAAPGEFHQKCILNISSGAGHYPVGSWSVYCAAKAGINLFSEVVKKDHPTLRCHATAPGIVDTEMQGQIRAVAPADFPDHQRFVDYHQNGELISPAEVAQKLMYVLDRPQEFQEVQLSLREVTIPEP